MTMQEFIVVVYVEDLTHIRKYQVCLRLSAIIVARCNDTLIIIKRRSRKVPLFLKKIKIESNADCEIHEEIA